MNQEIGVFRGTILRQTKGTVGGARSVFAKFKGIKNELVYPFNGGMIKNPPLGVGFKMFAGDLMEYRTNEKYARPEVYLLKTYEVFSVSGNTVNIVRNGFRHIPFVGDMLGVAPDEIGGEMTAHTVTGVTATTVSGTDVWAVTFDVAVTTQEGGETTEGEGETTEGEDVLAKAGDVLVEADADGNMMVKNINAFADCDMDMPYVGTNNASDFETAKYLYTPAVGGAYIYIYKMSPLPQCVLDVNKSQFNGLFKLPTVG